jgi:hypothetical protein
MRLLMVCAAFVVLVVGALALKAQVPIPSPNPNPTVLSGSDLGFQVDSTSGGIPTGRFVVKVDGKWVEPKYTSGVRRLGGE